MNLQTFNYLLQILHTAKSGLCHRKAAPISKTQTSGDNKFNQKRKKTVQNALAKS